MTSIILLDNTHVSYTDSLDEVVDGDSMSLEYRGTLSRVQRQMLALLPRYCQTQKLHKQLSNLEAGSDKKLTELREQAELAVEEIASNVVAFCRAVISKSGANSQFFRILFGPSLTEAMGRDFRMLEGK
jgi:nuclear pore complex protein Nup205